jgi:folylpolyglutamate synthase/dihydropteroate synthase
VLSAADLAAVTGGEAEPDPVRARERAIQLAGSRGAVIVCGSLYLLHDLITRSQGAETARSTA